MDRRVRVCVLGPFELFVDGERIELLDDAEIARPTLTRLAEGRWNTAAMAVESPADNGQHDRVIELAAAFHDEDATREVVAAIIGELVLDGDAPEPDLMRLDDHFADPETARLVRELIAGLEPSEIAAVDLDPSLRAPLASGARIDLVAEALDDRNDGDGESDDGSAVTLGLFREDRIVRGARSHLSAEFDHVVFGHTHHIVDGMELAPGKKLFNSGTWIPVIKLAIPMSCGSARRTGSRASC